ncbi:MAG TPA: extracellular solute-binding protein [Methylomirabilota bacterium]|jgi:multiple sugar transport system substrate-binding protein|nr:extracellular solute-binding protein [Methylomirabilota bacterium]
MSRLRANGLRILAALAAGAWLGLSAAPTAAAGKLSIAYMPHPIHEQQLKWMKKWGEMNGVEIRPTPISYEVYVEKLTASFLAKSQEYDIIWHNDDWGQLWGAYMEPVEDVKGLAAMDRHILVDQAMLWKQPDGKKAATAIPFNETLGVFFYRKDLISEAEYPKTWADLVRVSQRLQKEGKVKWGFVGGLKYPHSWFTLLWSLWTNDCDLFSPYNERDNEVLAKNGWKSMLGEKCAREAIEFWWDNINVHKISPPALVSYTRTEADGIFMAGDAFMTMNDTPLYSKYNDPGASKVAGKVAMGRFPLGPSSTKKGLAWRAAWFWAVPKAISPEQKKLAKALLSWMLDTEEVQRDIWKSAAGIPPITKAQAALAKEDPLFVQVKSILLDAPYHIVPAYYFKQWPEVHATFADVASKALIGRREDIPKVLAEGAQKLTNVMK